MTNDDRIRQLRKHFAQDARRRTDWVGPLNRSESLGTRRDMRKLRQALFKHPVFLRLLNELERDSDAHDFVRMLMMLKLFARTPITREEAKQARRRYLEAESEVKRLAQLLRVFVESERLSVEHRELLLWAAKKIEHGPTYAIGGKLRSAATICDFSLFGQVGDTRAFLISNLNAKLPSTVRNRNATIRDFLRLIGIEATRSLIGSTIRQGRR